MLLKELIKSSTAIALVALVAFPAFAQKEQAERTDIAKEIASTPVSENGELAGSILKAAGDRNVAVAEAQVSLVSQGKVIDLVKTNASGQFSFQDVQPGQYQVVGSASGLVGSQMLNVTPFNESQPPAPSQVTLHPTTAEHVYSNYSSTPVSTLSTTPAQSYGGGGRFGGGSIRGSLGLSLIHI